MRWLKAICISVCIMAAGSAVAFSMPKPPSLSEFSFSFLEKKLPCGSQRKARHGEEDWVFYYTNENKIFALSRDDWRHFQTWIDLNGDGTYDEYFEGDDGYTEMLLKYPHPCSIFEKEHV